MANKDRIERRELRIAAVLSGIFFLRMLGLFMLLPVLALYGSTLAGASPLLIGIALGIYGLTQAIFQIPFGWLSDRLGRKPVITIGLLIFAAGGAVAALGGQITSVVVGRALQGTGAISGATLALAADLTRPAQRTKVMAIIGISIGLSFSIAFVLGPIIDGWLGLNGLFWVAAALGIAALPLLWWLLPAEVSTRSLEQAPLSAVSTVERPKLALHGLYLGVFCLHGILAASFVSIPLVLLENLGIPSSQHYTVYLPVLLVSLVCVGPMIMYSHRTHLGTRLFRFAIASIALGEFILWRAPPVASVIGLGLVAFFIGFNFLEASLPSIVSQTAPSAERGRALGTYSAAQFLGMFSGGLGGGAVSSAHNFNAVFGVCGAVGVIWIMLSFLSPPTTLATK